MTLRTHIIQSRGPGLRGKPDITTACGRSGWHLAGFQYVSHTGKTRFNAVTPDQKPAPGYDAVPWVDCRECLAALGHPQDGLTPREQAAFYDWARSQPSFTSLDPLTGMRLREQWEKEGRP